jgi:hypothetical protein
MKIHEQPLLLGKASTIYFHWNNRVGTGGDYLPPSSIKIKNGKAISPLPCMPSWHTAQFIKHRGNFTLLGAISLGVKKSGCEIDHSPPSSTKVKNDEAAPPLPHMFS